MLINISKRLKIKVITNADIDVILERLSKKELSNINCPEREIRPCELNEKPKHYHLSNGCPSYKSCH